MRSHNTIVTKGLGRHNNLVARGFVRGFIETIIAGTQHIVRVGRSGAKRIIKEVESIMIYAKLIDVNDFQPKVKIEGVIKVDFFIKNYAVSLVESIKHRIKSKYNEIKISIERLR
jgi:hypothetical protein